MYYVAYTMLNYPNSIVSKTTLFHIYMFTFTDYTNIVQGGYSPKIANV